jgi:branched-chain amino acid transport system substrate-binding protein
MPSTLKIGVLCPYSSVYPSMAQDLMHGIMAGLPDSLHRSVELIPEYVQQGEEKLVQSALQKMLAFHRVDVVTGPVSYRSLPQYIPIIESSGSLAIFTDLGEYIPFHNHLSESVFLNSMFYWQAEYALGFWAQKKFGDRGAVVMPLYEAGYHMHAAFRQGTVIAGSEVVDYITLPGDPSKKLSIADYFEELGRHFEANGLPSYLHLLFSGNEAVQCYEAASNQTWMDDLPLIVSPHMASREMLGQVGSLNMTAYSAGLWNYDSEEKANRLFRERYMARTGKPANTMALLGCETGLALAQVHNDLAAGDRDKARRLMKSESIRTPRGERNFHLESAYARPVIDIEKLILNGNGVRKVITEQGRAMPYDDVIFEEIHRENVSGWKNPYLCV